FARNVAQLGEGGVVNLVAIRIIARPGFAVDDAGRADDDEADARGFELLHDLPLISAVVVAPLVVQRAVAAVVHAVAGGDDRRLEDEAVLDAVDESAGLLASPAK